MQKGRGVVFLLQAASQIEAEVVKALLKSEGIECFDEAGSLGGYNEICMGSSLYGKNIYVREEDFAAAHALAQHRKQEYRRRCRERFLSGVNRKTL